MWLDAFYHSLNPVALSLGPLSIRWYGLAYLVGFVLAGVVMYRTAQRWKLNVTLDDVLNLMVGISFGVIVGARLFYVIFYGAGYYVAHPLDAFALSQGGMSFHGGLVGAVVGGSIVCKASGLSIPTICDLGVIGAPLGLFFGRCANFINGELWGKPTDLPWGVMFETGGAVYRHPSQLYEALLEGLVTFLMLYGIFRFVVEFVRVPDEQLGYLFGSFITMGQLLSLPLVVLGIVVLVLARRLNSPQVGRN